MNSKTILLVLGVLLALAPITAFGGNRAPIGAVYAMNNEPDGNGIVVFSRDSNGHLTPAGTYTTGGLGTGGGIDPLASQNSLIISGNKRWLIAVNAGSDDISVFRVRRNYLELTGYYDSGGTFPSSLALHRNLLYVLNADPDGGSPNISAFNLNRRGQLKPLAGSTRALPGSGYHQVGFSPSGDGLVVTKGGGDADQILVFAVDEDGLTEDDPAITPSAGIVPFGFIFDWRSHLLVAEAGSRAVSTYALFDDNSLSVISPSVSNGNAATCWIAGTWFGAVFTANTGNDNLSAYKVSAADGSIRLKEADAAAGNKPIDIVVTAGGRFLYALNAGDGTVGSFRILPHGGLKALGRSADCP